MTKEPIENMPKNKNVTEGGLYEALFAVQQAAPVIGKESENPYFNSKYADLPTIWAAIRALMGENKLLVTHQLDCHEGSEYIVTRIRHVPTGESIESMTRVMLQKATAQEYGSFITYMRRYNLSAMLGLVTDDDDDGNKATDAAKDAGKVAAKQEPPENAKAITDAMFRLKKLTSYGQIVAFCREPEIQAVVKGMSPNQVKWWDEQIKAAQDRVGGLA